MVPEFALFRVVALNTESIDLFPVTMNFLDAGYEDPCGQHSFARPDAQVICINAQFVIEDRQTTNRANMKH